MDNQLPVKSRPEQGDNRKKLIRDVLVFQGKLAMDGIRDLVLSPVSIIVAIYGIVTNPNNPSIHFQSLMQFGRKSDDFINLFGHNSHAKDRHQKPISDDYADQIEAVITKQLKKENAFFAKKNKMKGNQNQTSGSPDA